MVVTEVKVKLVVPPSARLLAFATITIDGWLLIREIKIINSGKSQIIAMPSRKLTDHCKKCSGKNHLLARFCNQCGAHLPEKRVRVDERGRAKLHADMIHPITLACRQCIQDAVLKAYGMELEKSRSGQLAGILYDGEDDESLSDPDCEQPLDLAAPNTEPKCP